MRKRSSKKGPAKTQKPATRPPTGTDVALLAGVSKSAVSRAFTGGVVGEDSRDRILEAARKLKYRPSPAARWLTTRKSRLVGVVVTQLDNQFYPEVVQRFAERLNLEGLRIVLFITRGERKLEPVVEELLSVGLDGVVLASSSFANEVAAECVNTGLPVVMFNNFDPQARAPSICADNAHGAASAAGLLLEAGHRRLGIVTGLEENLISAERSEAFCQAVAAGGGTVQSVSGAYTFEGAYRATQTLLETPEGPDAIFCINDHMAIAALQAAKALGRQPGKDVSIVGFDDVGIAGWPAFALTTYAQPLEAMVEHAVATLLKAMRGTPLPAGTTRIQGKLILRQTVIPAAARAM